MSATAVSTQAGWYAVGGGVERYWDGEFPNVKARLADLGGMLIPGSPADFGKLVAAETEKWAKVIKDGGVSLE